MSLVFAAHAVVAGSWAPRLPAIKDRAQLSNGQLGVALVGGAVGLLIGTRLATSPVDRHGSRFAMRIGLPALCATLIGPALATNLAGLAIALLFFGAAAGFLDVAMNANAVAVERGYERPIMSSLHALWSSGGLVGAACAATAAGVGASPLQQFAVVAVVVGAGAIVPLRRLLPAAEEHTQADGVRGTRRDALWSSAVLLLGLIGFSSFVGEGTAFDWSAVYLRDDLGTSSAVAAAGFAAFSAAMAGTRFVADRLAARFGPVAVVRSGALVAAAGLGLGVLVDRPVSAVLGFALVGAGLAPVVPITFSAAGNTGLGSTGAILGRVVSISYLGSILGPLVIGTASEHVGLRTALTLPIALALVIAASATRVSPAAGRPPGPAPEYPG